jgi:hypothetical protein
MNIVHFQKIHPLLYSHNPCLHPLFQTAFGGLHYAIFIYMQYALILFVPQFALLSPSPLTVPPSGQYLLYTQAHYY